jgi:hypothetical protein
MNTKLNQNASAAPLVTLPLKSATVRIASRPKIAIGSASLEFVGRHSRSVRFTFLPKRPTVPGSGPIELKMSRVQAWALAEWIIDESTKRSSHRVS